MSTFGIILVVLSLALGTFIAVLGTHFSKKKLTNKEAYFTAGRNISVAFMTASFIAYAVGTGLIFSPGETAYTTGLTAMIGYGLAISLAYVFFIPFTKKIRQRIPEGHTIGEYAKARYGRPMYLVCLAVSIIYMFVLLCSNLIGAAIAFKYIGGVPMIISILTIGIPTIYFAAFGGVGAAIFTSGLQSLLITPLLLIPSAVAIFGLGGPGAIFDGLMEKAPDLLKIDFGPGVQFAIMIVIAVAAAEMLNQTLWQRIYTAESPKVIKKSLLSAAVMTFPMTIIAALFGLTAIILPASIENTSIASAMAISQTVPQWACAIFVLVVVLAASSTGGDALSGFASIISLDIVKPLKPNISAGKAMSIGRIGVMVCGVAAMIVAYFEPSILMLLLTADLLATAAIIPVMVGLYSRRVSGIWAAAATICGILAGLPLFGQYSNLYSFLLAMGTSGLIVVVGHFAGKKEYNFDRLKTEITHL